MKPIVRQVVFIILLLLPTFVSAQENPQADARAVVVAGNARFTVLTPQLIRMEWSEDGVFEDRATLTFVNRKTDVPNFSCFTQFPTVICCANRCRRRYCLCISWYRNPVLTILFYIRMF